MAIRSERSTSQASARADLRKVGRRVANVHVEAWQEAREQPIAFLRGHFLLSGDS